MAITLNLVVNKQKNRVLYAECDSNFVDILLSFMTLPLGTIVRLLNKKSGLEFLDNLYQSIDNLETKYFQTESCKSMLLQPRSTAEQQCEDLAINIDDLDPRRLFRCQNWDCYSNKHPHYSSVVGVKCPCGQIMDKSICWLKKDNDTVGGVFLKCSSSFIVSDDLHLQAVSSIPSVSFLQRLGVNDISMLEEIEIQVEKFQVPALLKRSFHSKTPLTDVFLNNLTTEDAVKSEKFNTNVKIKCEDEVPVKEHHIDNQLNAIRVKVLLSKSSSKAILVRSENDFADLVFSFLTFPLGCTLSLLGNRYSSSTLGCIHNIYNSISDLKDDKQEIISAVSKDMLLYPKLAPYFGCSDQAVKVNEMQSTVMSLRCCQSCFNARKSVCLHNPSDVTVTELNPKMTKASSEYGGGFARSSSRFLIYSDMKVKPMPTISMIQQLKDLGTSSLDDLSDKEVTVTEAEALKLLFSCLTSTPFLNFK